MTIKRRARDKQGNIIAAMDLANMRSHGVRSVSAKCVSCQHEATINVDALPDDMAVPDVGLKLRCSKCGGKQIETRPKWQRRFVTG